MSQNYTKHDINDLMNRGYTFVLNPNDHDYINNWCYHSTLPLCVLFITEGIYSDEKCENLLKPNHAVIIENSPAYAFINDLNDYWNNGNTEKDFSKCTFIRNSHVALGFTKLFVGEGYQTFLVSKKSPFEPGFSNTVMELLESGIIQYWASIEQRMIKRYENVINKSRRVSMKLDKLMFAFEIWFFGIVCSFFIFFLENRKYHCRN
ncbi:uncharacterized protein LOC130900079 [Diorhabda carinulata]|uniref:uncharacterized protein LOC130900079 n=1 Tax=Diorhabda carinulata TaxID=1163345 RepID=UPI0025A0750D|nr:uncharacterized protein LOC130900079 [Diorhabda carinulata]